MAGQHTTFPGITSERGRSQGRKLSHTAEDWGPAGMLWLSLAPLRETSSTMQ